MISQDYLKIQDEYLKNEIKSKGIIDSNDISFDKGVISIWKGDITTLKCDVIVDACNKYLLGCFNPTHRCVDNEIHSFAGIQLRNECNDIMRGSTLENGKVILTSAYNLPSKYIIHTVGPLINDNILKKDIDDLKSCYYNSLELARKNNLRSIAFPCISTGLYGFPREEACNIAVEVVTKYLSKNSNVFDHVIFDVFLDDDFNIYKNKLLGENYD